MKKENVEKKVLVKSLVGFTVGVTLLMISYASVYFISGESIFQNEITQLQNIKALITQIIVSGVAYYLLFISFHIFSIMQNKELKEQYMNIHPYRFVLTESIVTLLFILISIFMISNTHIYSENIKDLNIILLVSIYAIIGLCIILKCTVENYLLEKINKKLRERNS